MTRVYGECLVAIITTACCSNRDIGGGGHSLDGGGGLLRFRLQPRSIMMTMLGLVVLGVWKGDGGDSFPGGCCQMEKWGGGGRQTILGTAQGSDEGRAFGKCP